MKLSIDTCINTMPITMMFELETYITIYQDAVKKQHLTHLSNFKSKHGHIKIVAYLKSLNTKDER